MRELDLFRQHLAKQREKHLKQAHKVAVASAGPSDYLAIVSEAKAADVLARLMDDIKELDHDSGAFIKRHLQ